MTKSQYLALLADYFVSSANTVIKKSAKNPRKIHETRKRIPTRREDSAMAAGIKDKVAILGMGCSKFGERWESGAEELMVEAYLEGLKDAGVETSQIQRSEEHTSELQSH